VNKIKKVRYKYEEMLECPFCGVIINPQGGVERLEDLGHCDHILFVAHAEGFDSISKSFLYHMGNMNTTTFYEASDYYNFNKTVYDNYDELTDDISIPGAIKYVENSDRPWIIGLAPRQYGIWKKRFISPIDEESKKKSYLADLFCSYQNGQSVSSLPEEKAISEFLKRLKALNLPWPEFKEQCAYLLLGYVLRLKASDKEPSLKVIKKIEAAVKNVVPEDQMRWGKWYDDIVPSDFISSPGMNPVVVENRNPLALPDIPNFSLSNYEGLINKAKKLKDPKRQSYKIAGINDRFRQIAKNLLGIVESIEERCYGDADYSIDKKIIAQRDKAYTLYDKIYESSLYWCEQGMDPDSEHLLNLECIANDMNKRGLFEKAITAGRVMCQKYILYRNVLPEGGEGLEPRWRGFAETLGDIALYGGVELALAHAIEIRDLDIRSEAYCKILGALIATTDYTIKSSKDAGKIIKLITNPVIKTYAQCIYACFLARNGQSKRARKLEKEGRFCSLGVIHAFIKISDFKSAADRLFAYVQLNRPSLFINREFFVSRTDHMLGIY